VSRSHGAADFPAALAALQADGTNYLIPVEEVAVDSETALKRKAVAVSDVLKMMEARECQLNFIILDACRNQPSRMERSLRSAPRGLAEMKAPAGSVIAFACAPGMTAADGKGDEHGAPRKRTCPGRATKLTSSSKRQGAFYSRAGISRALLCCKARFDRAAVPLYLRLQACLPSTCCAT
jgi:hypothetical protein